MTPTEQTRKHVISHYVDPARQRGETTIQIRVGNVQKELGWTNRTPSVYSTLASKEFQRQAGLELIEKKGGPPSGGPSTTVQFLYRLSDADSQAKPEKIIPNGAGLLALVGLCKETFRQLGGGEEFMRQERDWGPDVWERYEQELLEQKASKSTK